MRIASSLLRLLWAGSAGLLLFTGCQQFIPLMVHNATDQPIRVKVGDTRKQNRISPTESMLARCRYEGFTLRLAHEDDTLSGNSRVVPMLAMDMERCEFEFEIPAHHLGLIGMNGSCSDAYQDATKNPAIGASPDFLRIEGVKGTIELHGLQVALHLKRQRSWTQDRCLMVYQ
jgi:hypothetical protein